MPQVDPQTGEPMTDDPNLEDEDQRGGTGKGPFVNATESPDQGSGVVTGPDNPRESQPGATQGEGDDLSGSDASGGAG
jgi:hypothetical protein